MKIVVDSNATIPESDEENNETVMVYPIPLDLTIKEITVSPSDPKEGDNVNFDVVIENMGDIKTAGLGVGYYVNAIHLGFTALDAMNPDTTASSTLGYRGRKPSTQGCYGHQRNYP